MKFLRFIFVSITLMFWLVSSLSAFAESKRKWNNPENERRYKESLNRQSEAYRGEAKAWQNYDRELGRAQDDVREVAKGATKGAVSGGAPGAAWGVAKGAAKRIYNRSKE